MTESLHIDTLAAGRRPLKDTDSADTSTTRDPNLRHIMVDDPATGRRPAAVPADLWNHGGAHQKWSVDDFTLGRHPMGSDPLSALLATAAFYAPLKSTLVLTRGTGNPTYTRATSAWEFDNEGKLITVPSGAARFGGGRMVRNLAYASETFTGWYAVNSATVLNKALTFGQATSRLYATVSLAAQSVLRFYIALSTADVGKQFRFAYYDPSTGWIYSPDQTIPANGICAYTFTASTNLITYAGLAAASTWSAPETINLAAAVGRIEIENVSGQSDQTASEYVSVGVLSAPYHGAGVDGVKWFETNKDGSAISEANLLGYHAEGARTNSLLYSRDLTNATWVKTNVTATLTATGIDNAANSASTLTAGAANATILQTLSLAAAARSSSAYVKRRTGTGNIYFTRDGGSTWTDITSSVGASMTRVKIENTSVLNPSIGFKIATSGDAIDVDCVQDEAGAYITSPIITTSAAVTRNADALTYATASNWSDTAGWALASVYKPDWTYVAGGVIGNATNGLLPLTTNTGAKAYDGTNTVNGPTGAPSGTVKMAMNWGSGALQVAANGTAGTAGSYDGAWGLASIGINTSAGAMYTKNVYIAQAAITAAQLAQVTA